MKFSEKWLREFVNPDIDTDLLIEQLTMVGLEVDGVESAYPQVEGLVVARVNSVKKHPDADRLHICQVDYGEPEPLTIVCGAPNVREGMYTILAKTGAKLPDKPVLNAVTLKGIVSNGMLCSANEIGLGEDHDSIIELSTEEPVGKPLNEIIDPDDNIIEISLTPNRGDCLSIKGISREVAAINQLKSPETNINITEITSSASRNISLSAAEVCPRYIGRVIENVNTATKSPLWLVEKLRCCGIRSINIVVDITNFVMLELGQPMHAFDNDKLDGDIQVRFSKQDEKIKLLNGSEHDIKPGTLLIADDSGPLAMAGLMGGFDSAVTEQSKNIFLESAFFKPEIIIGKARQYGLHTDSSHRFERGVDPELQEIAIGRATRLLIELCGGETGPAIEAGNDEYLPKNKPVNLRQTQIKRILGIALDNDFVTKTFERLGMDCNFKENQWIVIPPSHRFDINIEVDLIEELARIYSYDAISVVLPRHSLKMRNINYHLERVRKARQILSGRDYQEVISYSFVDPELNKLLKNNEATMLLANPISPELAEMRTSLWPGLINTLLHNIKRQHERVRLFETGLVFNGNKELKQDHHIAGIIYGNINEKQWDKKEISCDFYDMKTDLETLLYSLLNKEQVKFNKTELVSLHPQQALEIIINGEIAGHFGQLHPAISASLDLRNKTYLFEIKIENFISKKIVNYQPISRFPVVKRDISIQLDEGILFADIVKSVENDAAELLIKLELFDVYQGEGIEKGKKSLALGLTFQATSSTLNDGEIETIMEKVVDGLHNKFAGKLRE